VNILVCPNDRKDRCNNRQVNKYFIIVRCNMAYKNRLYPATIRLVCETPLLFVRRGSV
jgi:hypothetical protein